VSELIPIKYFQHLIGYATTDQAYAADLRRLRWDIEIPRSIRAMYKTPDVLLAALREDQSVLDRCTPFTQFNGLVLRLNRLIVRPEVIPFVLEFVDSSNLEALAQIRLFTSDIKRVIHLNGRRTDCQRGNLSVITLPGVSQDPTGVFHE